MAPERTLVILMIKMGHFETGQKTLLGGGGGVAFRKGTKDFAIRQRGGTHISSICCGGQILLNINYQKIYKIAQIRP